jgi:hypothetical protein
MFTGGEKLLATSAAGSTDTIPSSVANQSRPSRDFQATGSWPTERTELAMPCSRP